MVSWLKDFIKAVHSGGNLQAISDVASYFSIVS